MMQRLMTFALALLVWTGWGQVPQALAQSYEQVFPKMADILGAAIEKAELRNIAVVDFDDLQGQTTELGRFLAEEMSTSLVSSGLSFSVIDRANFRYILQEAKLSAEGLVNPENTKKLGEIAGVDALITGTITPMAENVRVSVKVIATESARIVAAHNGTITASASIQEMIRRVVATSALDSSVNSRQAPSGGSRSASRGEGDSVYKDLDGKLEIRFERLGKQRGYDRYAALFSVENNSDSVLELFFDINYTNNNILHGDSGEIIPASHSHGRLITLPGKSRGAFTLNYGGTGASAAYDLAALLVLKVDNRNRILSFTFEGIAAQAGGS